MRATGVFEALRIGPEAPIVQPFRISHSRFGRDAIAGDRIVALVSPAIRSETLRPGAKFGNVARKFDRGNVRLHDVETASVGRIHA